jgi:thiamine-phosphate pyrophosphorylase
MAAHERHARLDRAQLYFICDAAPGGRPLADVLPAALRGGVDVFQLRMKDADDAAIRAAGAIAAAACCAAGALFILNDRPDLAPVTGADGAHVGQDDLTTAEARALIGGERLLGRSTHSPAQIDAAADVDYIGVGPVHATPTKPGRPAVGAALVQHAAAHARPPFFAIGGVDERTLPAVLAAGARRVAVVRAIAEAADPEAVARRLSTALGAANATDAECRGAA